MSRSYDKIKGEVVRQRYWRQKTKPNRDIKDFARRRYGRKSGFSQTMNYPKWMVRQKKEKTM